MSRYLSGDSAHRVRWRISATAAATSVRRSGISSKLTAEIDAGGLRDEPDCDSCFSNNASSGATKRGGGSRSRRTGWAMGMPAAVRSLRRRTSVRSVRAKREYVIGGNSVASTAEAMGLTSRAISMEAARRARPIRSVYSCWVKPAKPSTQTSAPFSHAQSSRRSAARCRYWAGSRRPSSR